MATEVFNVFGQFRLKGGKELNKFVSDMDESLNKVGGGLLNVGTKLSALSLAIAGATLQGLRYNSQLENLNTTFKVLLGSEEKAAKMTETLQKIGAETPFEITGLAEVTQTLLAFGVDSQKAIPMMLKLGDVALGNQEKFSGMAYAMGQIASKGKAQTEELNMLIERGWNPLYNIMDRTGESMTQVRKRLEGGKISFEEISQALADTTAKGGRFYKGMDEGSKTLEGRLSTLSDEFNNMLANATKPLFDYIRDVAVPKLIDLVGAFNDLDPVVKNATLVIIGLTAGLGPLLLLVGGIITGIGAFSAALSAISIPLLLVIGLAATLAGGIVLIGVSIGKALQDSEKVDLIKNKFNELKDAISPIGDVIHGIFTGDREKVIDTLYFKLGLTKDQANDFYKSVENLRIKFGDLTDTIGEKVINKLVELMQWTIDNKEEIILFTQEVIDFGTKFVESTKKALKDGKEFAKGVKSAYNTVTDAIKQVVEWHDKLLDKISSFSFKDFASQYIGMTFGGKSIEDYRSKERTQTAKGYATGTEFFAGGLALVGERGPELLNLPRGTQITSSNNIANNYSRINPISSNMSTKNYYIDKVILNTDSIDKIKKITDLFEMLEAEYITQ